MCRTIVFRSNFQTIFYRILKYNKRVIHMARVKIEDIIDHLSSEMRKSLRDSVNKVIPEVTFDERELFKQFKREVSRKCSTWERVPDRYIDSEY